MVELYKLMEVFKEVVIKKDQLVIKQNNLIAEQKEIEKLWDKYDDCGSPHAADVQKKLYFDKGDQILMVKSKITDITSEITEAKNNVIIEMNKH